MNGTVLIRNVEFQGKHGASADERRSSRRFQVDVDLTFPVTALRRERSPRRHRQLSRRLRSGRANRRGAPYRLLEALAAEMLREMRSRWPQAQIVIELRKLHPPCPGNPAYTAVRLAS